MKCFQAVVIQTYRMLGLTLLTSQHQNLLQRQLGAGYKWQNQLSNWSQQSIQQPWEVSPPLKVDNFRWMAMFNDFDHHMRGNQSAKTKGVQVGVTTKRFREICWFNWHVVPVFWQIWSHFSHYFVSWGRFFFKPSAPGSWKCVFAQEPWHWTLGSPRWQIQLFGLFNWIKKDIPLALEIDFNNRIQLGFFNLAFIGFQIIPKISSNLWLSPSFFFNLLVFVFV